MVCYNCGKTLNPGKRFCSECGTENLITEEELAIDRELSKRFRFKRDKKPLKSPKRTAITALVLSVLAIHMPVLIGLVLSAIAFVGAKRALKESESVGVRRLAKIGKILSALVFAMSVLATATAVLAIIALAIFIVIYVIVAVAAFVLSYILGTTVGASVISIIVMALVGIFL